VIYAVLVALLMMAADLRLPTPLDHAFTILGGLAIPLMLLTLGHTLATLRVGALWRGAWLALFHLAMAAAVAFALVQLFGLEGTPRGVLILQCMTPISVATYLYVEMYQEEHAPEVAGLILISTLLGLIALPLVLTVWI
jgi:predicted permease